MANYSPKEIAFQSIDYGSPEVIQALLRFYHDFRAKGQENFSEGLTVVMVDLETALKTVKITARQQEALDYYMEGWTEEEIGDKMGGITHQAVHKLIVKVCEKVSNHLKDKVDN